MKKGISELPEEVQLFQLLSKECKTNFGKDYIANELAMKVTERFKNSIPVNSIRDVSNYWYSLFLSIIYKAKEENNVQKYLNEVILYADNYEYFGLIMTEVKEIINNEQNIKDISIEKLCRSTKAITHIYNNWDEKLKKAVTPILTKKIEEDPFILGKYIVISYNIFTSARNSIIAQGFNISTSAMQKHIKDDLIGDYIKNEADFAIALEVIDPIMKATGYYSEDESIISRVFKKIFCRNNEDKSK